MKNSITTKLFIIISAALIGMGMFLSNKSQAQNSTTPFTGSCGGVFNVNSIHDVLWEYVGNSIDSEGVSIMMSMNFDTRKVDILSQSIEINRVAGKGFGATLAPRPEQVKTRALEVTSSVAFTIEPFNGVSGAYLTTLISPFPGVENITFVIMPVNGGNTFLIQGKSFSAAGVCQKV